MSPLIRKSEQQKHEQHSENEAIALQKLVTAVLDGTGTTKPRRHSVKLGLPRRFRRLRVALIRRVRRHPLLSIAVLGGSITLAVLSSMKSVSDANTDTDTIKMVEGAGVPSRTGSGSTGSTGPTGSTGSTRSTRSTRSAAKAFRPGQYDVAKVLIVSVTDGDYQRPEDVATGRFLLDFPNQWLLLAYVDTTQLLPIRRGKNWVQLTGPYRSTHVPSHRVHLEDGPRRRDKSEDAIIRLAKVKDKTQPERQRVWKIEHIRVY